MTIEEIFKPLARRLARGLQKLPIPSTILGSPKHCIDDSEHWTQKIGGPSYGVSLTSVSAPYEEPFEAPLIPADHFRLDTINKLQLGRFTLRFPNYSGRIYFEGCVITPDDGILLKESGIRKGREESHVALTRLRYPYCRKIDGTVAIITYGSPGNYYHWLFEILPRLQILKEAGSFDEIDHFVLSNELPFQIETLNLLGIPKNRIIQANKHLHIRPKTLILPSVAGNAEAPPKWVCQWLRENFLVEPTEEHRRRRIFVERGGVKRRKLLNEQALCTLLDSHGFERVNPGLLSFQEQMRLFSEAAIVIGVHGAALSNLVFCSPQTSVIELFSPWYVNPVYRFISFHVDLRYYPVIGLGERPPHENLPGQVAANIEVDLSAISDILFKLSEKP